MLRKILVPLLVLALVLMVGTAGAQKKKKGKKAPEPAPTEVPAAPAPEPPAPDPAEAKKADARSHFERALSLFDEEAWDAALVEFERSRELYPTRAATKNAAICLRRLHRFDEALDMFDTLLREFPDLPPQDKAIVEREVSELRVRVGTVDVQMTEPGASIVIDGRDRGTSPPAAPLRVSVGSHLVRVYKKGFSPFERRVDVSGGQNVPIQVKLAALTRSGTLKVTEQNGKNVDVLVDNVVVGQTPWEGPLPLGDHTVLLRGEGVLGTQPASVAIELNRDTALTLAIEALHGELRVEPAPVSAQVAIDGVSVGRGVWDGRLRAGQHKVEATADGFLVTEKQLTLEKGKRQTLKLVLERDPDSPLWQSKTGPSVFLELDTGALWTPTVGSDLDDSCKSGCDKGFNVGGSAALRLGYLVTSAVGLSLDLGYLAVQQKLSGREAPLTPVGRPANQGKAFDKLWLQGVTIGASVGVRTASKWPLTFRVGGGAFLGKLTDTRSGRYTTNPDSTGQSVDYRIDGLEESKPARYAFAAPEIRIGRRLGRRSELSFGVQGLFLFALTQPKWEDDHPVLTGNCGATPTPGCFTEGEGTFGTQNLAGKLVILVAPQLGFRQDF
jgi:hypothetical protein